MYLVCCKHGKTQAKGDFKCWSGKIDMHLLPKSILTIRLRQKVLQNNSRIRTKQYRFFLRKALESIIRVLLFEGSGPKLKQLIHYWKQIIQHFRMCSDIC